MSASLQPRIKDLEGYLLKLHKTGGDRNPNHQRRYGENPELDQGLLKEANQSKLQDKVHVEQNLRPCVRNQSDTKPNDRRKDGSGVADGE